MSVCSLHYVQMLGIQHRDMAPVIHSVIISATFKTGTKATAGHDNLQRLLRTGKLLQRPHEITFYSPFSQAKKLSGHRNGANHNFHIFSFF